MPLSARQKNFLKMEQSFTHFKYISKYMLFLLGKTYGTKWYRKFNKIRKSNIKNWNRLKKLYKEVRFP